MLHCNVNSVNKLSLLYFILCEAHLDFIVEGKKVEQLELIVHFSAENGSSSGLSSDVLEADAKQIAEMARQTFDMYDATSFLFFND